MVRFLTVGVVLTCLIVSAATPAFAAAEEGAGPGVYQEADANITLQGSWTITSHSRDSGGGSAYLTSPGSASLTFNGSSVTVVGRKTPSASYADVFIDNTKVASVDRYSSSVVYQQELWSSSALTNGQHTIRVEWSPVKNPAVTSPTPSLSLDAIIVPASASGPGVYQEADANITLQGSWTITSHSRDSGGGSAYLTSPGSASLTFNGSSVTVVGRKTPSASYADVFIDNTKVASVDRYSSSVVYQQELWSSSALTNGQHTIRVEWSPVKNPAVTSRTPSLSLDAIIVPGTEPVAPGNVAASVHGTTATVTWVAPSGDVAGYIVSRRSGSQTEKVADVPSTTTTTNDDRVVWGDTVEYIVSAIDSVGRVTPSTPSTPVTVGTPATTGTYNEDSPQVRFLGAWTISPNSQDLAGASKYSLAESSASIVFQGQSIRWVSRTGPKSGLARVLIDGTEVATVDRYTPENSYQKTVWQIDSLTAGNHRLDIEWTSARNALSTGSSLVLDAIVVAPQVSQAGVSSASVVERPSGARISWEPRVGADNRTFRVYRKSYDGTAELITELAPTERAYDDLGLTPDEVFSYQVTAVDGYGLESVPAATGTILIASLRPSNVARVEDCPSDATVVSTAVQFSDALKTAQAGTKIALAPGTYAGSFSITTSGTADNPIWVCGTSSSVIRPGTLTRGTGLYVSGANINIAGLSISTSLKGIMLVGAHNVTLADMTISDIGDEAVHFRNSSTQNILIGTTIRRTGLTTAGYGEGVYVGTSSTNWCTYNDCKVDRSDSNSIFDNTIEETPAEAIEVKEGVTNTRIIDNTVSTTVPAASGVATAVQLKGNSSIMMSNQVSTDRISAVRVLFTSGGWGTNNVLAANTLTLSAAQASGIYFAAQPNVAKCNNVTLPTGTPLGVTCQR